MQQVKVKNIQIFKMPKHNVTVVVGTFHFLWGDCRLTEFNKYGLESHDTTQFAKPIIVSNTETIEEGDLFIGETGIIKKCKTINRSRKQIHSEDGYAYFIHKCNKVLVLPDQFSPKQIQAMLDGKIKQNDEVFVTVVCKACQTDPLVKHKKCTHESPSIVELSLHYNYVTIHKMVQVTITELDAQKYGDYVSNKVLGSGEPKYLSFKDWNEQLNNKDF